MAKKKNKKDSESAKTWRIWRRVFCIATLPCLLIGPTIFATITLLGKNANSNSTSNSNPKPITCPYQSSDACSNTTVGVPCLATVNTNQGSDCRTACVDDKLSYDCACRQLPVGTRWSSNTSQCAYECLNSPGNCIDYLDGNFCMPLSCSNGGKACTTLCKNDTRSYKCPEKLTWIATNLKCELVCPNVPVDACSNATLGIPCLATMNTNKGINCKTTCFDNKLSYECECPKIPTPTRWDFNRSSCVYECTNSLGNCIDYLDGNFCIPLSCGNGGTNCSTICVNDTRSFKCDCQYNYTWIDYLSPLPTKLRCGLKCTKSLSNCTTKDENIDCISSLDLNKGLKCKTACDNNTMSYKCDCSSELAKKEWSNENLRCQYKCLNEAGDCVSYVKNESCSAVTEVNGGYNCKTYCNLTRSFSCKCPAPLGWNSKMLRCDKICSKKNLANCVPDLNCVAATDTRGGTACYLICDEGTQNFHCKCPTNMFWNYIYNICEKILPCFGMDRPALQLSADCLPLDLYTTSTVVGFDCRRCCNYDNLYTCSCLAPLSWNDDIKRCTQKCVISTTDKDCSTYANESPCFQSKETTRGAFNCKAICGATGKDFKCSCYPPTVWEPTATKHYCSSGSFCPAVMATLR